MGALDLHCYHVGLPLSTGDIEDIEGNLCIKCPWHRWIFKLESGEHLYHKIEYETKPFRKKRILSSKGKQQRNHKVIVNANTNKIYIVLNKNKEEYGSDKYAKHKELRFKIGDMVQANIGKYTLGKIVAVWDQGNAYRIEIQNEKKINVWAPVDVDAFVRAVQ